jgi:tetratricopeptide (TPR) repeat protein
MSQDRERPPQLPKPFGMSFQVRLQQPLAAPQWQFQAPAAPSIPERFQLALALHQQGRLIEAEQVYSEILQAEPAHFDALHLLGVLALQTLRTERGVELIGRAVALNPNSFGAHNNLGNGLRDLGRLDAALGSFDRSIALKPDFAEAHNNRGIVLQDLARLDDALKSFETAIALKPDHAEAHNNRGTVLRKLQRPAEAAASFDAAIASKPDYAAAYNNRGNLANDLEKRDDAIADFDRAIALQPDYAAAHYNRGIALQGLRRFDDALKSFDAAIARKPDYAEAYNNRGLVLQELRRPEDAIASFERAMALSPSYAEAHANQSLCLLQVGRFDRGFALYEWRKKLEQPFGNRAFEQPLWLGKEDISDRTVFVHWEQGLGDTIQFGRFAEQLKARGAKVAMSVQEPLWRLFKKMDPDIEIIKEDEVPAAFDFHCPLMSLPLALGARLESIPAKKPPYLFADESLRDVWRSRLPPKTKPLIGIVWSGTAKHKNDRQRSIDLPTFAPLISADAHWISLQKEVKDGDAALLRQMDQIVSYGEELTDFAETAAIVDQLDLVIAVDTSVVHLAGAMAKPVWILLPYNADWRWFLDRSDSPWYPTARLFRQDRTQSWTSVIADVRSALDEFLRSRG